ncbi:MAG: ABC transporter ATP-binding protein [Chloroflexi bacterium]|nr:ABC transporter ATP-binding protein [Chloroflexota bacterium]
MSKTILVKNLSKQYGDTVAVNNISFTVEKGEIFGLLGPNGAGKTTTLECLEGLRYPDGGSLQIAGIDPVNEYKKLRQVIGVQLQSAGMPDTITPDEAMQLFCAYHNTPPNYDLLDRFGLAEKRKTQFHQLSGGQQRRLALALAIAHKPPVLFLDEPTAALDVGTRAALHQVMHELRENGTTIILATHDMAEAEAMCDRVAIMLNGSIINIGTPLEITATGAELTKVSVRSQNGTMQHANGSIPAVQHRTIKDEYTIFFSTDIAQTVAAVIDQVTTANDELIDLRVERPSLEDRFLELTS